MYVFMKVEWLLESSRGLRSIKATDETFWPVCQLNDGLSDVLLMEEWSSTLEKTIKIQHLNFSFPLFGSLINAIFFSLGHFYADVVEHLKSGIGKLMKIAMDNKGQNNFIKAFSLLNFRSSWI